MPAAVRTLCVTLGLLVSVANSAEPIDLAADLSGATVIHGGHWVAVTSQGTYRVVVKNIGYEHATYRVMAQWVEDSATSSDQPRVKWSATLVKACLCAFDSPTVVQRSDGLHLVLTGQDQAGGPVKCEFVLGQRGNVVKASKC